MELPLESIKDLNLKKPLETINLNWYKISKQLVLPSLEAV